MADYTYGDQVPSQNYPAQDLYASAPVTRYSPPRDQYPANHYTSAPLAGEYDSRATHDQYGSAPARDEYGAPPLDHNSAAPQDNYRSSPTRFNESGYTEPLNHGDEQSAGVSASTSAPADERGKLFIGGLSWDTTQDGLKSYFMRFGEVVDALIMKDPTTGRSRGFGFVTFADPHLCDVVLQKGPHTLDNRTIEPKKAVPLTAAKPDRPSGVNAGVLVGGEATLTPTGEWRTKKVFVGGLPQEATEDSVREFFTEHGRVEEVLLMYDRMTNRMRGFGFVTFDSEDVAEKLAELKFVKYNGIKMVEIKKAEPKSIHDARLHSGPPPARGSSSQPRSSSSRGHSSSDRDRSDRGSSSRYSDRDGHDRGRSDRSDRDRSDRGDRDRSDRRDRGDRDRSDRGGDRYDRSDRGGSDRGGSDRGHSSRETYDSYGNSSASGSSRSTGGYYPDEYAYGSMPYGGGMYPPTAAYPSYPSYPGYPQGYAAYPTYDPNAVPGAAYQDNTAYGAVRPTQTQSTPSYRPY